LIAFLHLALKSVGVIKKRFGGQGFAVEAAKAVYVTVLIL